MAEEYIRSAEDWNVQISVKIGDHLTNIRGRSTNYVLERLEELASHADRVHAAMEALDGRPATEIVEKEKKWGARSQGGRSYPKSSPASQTASTASPAQSATPEQLIEKELGGTVIFSTEVDDSVKTCPVHEKPRQFFEGGVSAKTNKKYSASYRCPERGCKPLWADPEGAFR